MARKQTAPAKLPAPKVEALVVEEPVEEAEVAVDASVCPWCHTSTNKLHRRSGCGKG